MRPHRLPLVLLAVTLALPLPAQQNKDQIVIDIRDQGAPAAAAQPALSFVNGYRSPVSGEVLTYHSSHPDADTSLLVRSRRDILSAAWETDPLPEPAAGEPYRLIWLAGIEHKETGHSFELRINGRQWFTFRNPKGGSDDGFKVTSSDGGELAFETKMVDKFGDLFGDMFLTLPRKAFTPGEPLVLQVVGEDDNSADWYMTFQYRFSFTPSLRPEPALVNEGGQTRQLVRLSLDNLIGQRTIEITGPAGQHTSSPLNVGANIRLLSVDPAVSSREIPVLFRVNGKLVSRERVTVTPVARREIHLLPYSHNDIGYTDLQPNIERKQWQNLEQALDLIASTRDYPPEARFKWNLEVVWALDTYLRQATEARRTAVVEAARAGTLGVTALYANVLTGLAGATEMTHFTEYARRFSAEHGVPVTSAVVSDIPGFTWGLVPALAQSGVQYFSIAPNAGDRVGHIYDLGDRPFYWVSQSGEEKVLTWVAGASYSSFHEGEIDKLGDEKILKLVRKLEETRYPYDLVQLPYTVGGDNGPPDPNLPGFVRRWNERYVSPRLLISTHAQMFSAFEQRYGASLPSRAGDFTPYWEDGALSSAAETALARRAASRLIQGEALWALRSPTSYPAEEYAQAWRNVVLYDEHTWGAHNSVSEPDDPGVKGQWAIKRQFAVDADRQSQDLLARALPAAPARPSTDAAANAKAGATVVVDVYNTTSWPRTDLVLIPSGDSEPGDLVTDTSGREVRSQRLSTGELAVLVRDLPPLSAVRLTVRPGRATLQGTAKASRGTVETGTLAISVSQATGAIDGFRWKEPDAQLVDAATKLGLNQYLYVPGRNPEHALALANVTVRVKEAGPLLASLAVEAYAPGSRRYAAEIRLVDGLDRVDITNEIDKQAVRDKEGLHVAFPFNVPGGQLRYDVASGIVRPELDQIPGSCKNFFSVQSFVDVSNDQLGVTWAAVDAPLIEVGGITAEQPWMPTIRPSSLFYSYVMNNYWHTNYKADQEGPFLFRYALRPHRSFRPEDAARFGQEQREPLIVKAADPASTPPSSLFRLEPAEVLVSSVTPIDGGRSWLVSLYNPTAAPRSSRLVWREPRAVTIRASDLSGRTGPPVDGAFTVPPFGRRFVRVDATPTVVGTPDQQWIVLTPKPGPEPRINGARIFGARPGSPFLFTVPATGQRPLQFGAENLPAGLAIDRETGRITGRLQTPGRYLVTLTAANRVGTARRSFTIVSGDSLALTPHMGWNSWYVWENHVTDRIVREAAEAMVRHDLINHGYMYVNIDDCWAVKPGASDETLQGEPRDERGRVNANRRFPDMKALTDYIHSRGLKAGIYTSPGPTTCAGHVGAYQHEEADIRRFAEWGFDFLKYDWCSYGDIAKNPDRAALERPYRLASSILKTQDRDIVLNLCQYGMGRVWEWGRQVGGHSWRTAGDLGGSFEGIGTALFRDGFDVYANNGLHKFGGPGGWNDPDYLLLGYLSNWKGQIVPTPLTPDEQYTHVSLWALLAAPLIFSGDMTRLDEFTLGLLTNDEVIDVDQDPLGKPGRRMWKGGDTEVWARELEDGSLAVGLFNRGELEAPVTARWSDLGIAGPRIARDLWRQRDIGSREGQFTATVSRHGVVLVRLSDPMKR